MAHSFHTFPLKAPNLTQPSPSPPRSNRHHSPLHFLNAAATHSNPRRRLLILPSRRRRIDFVTARAVTDRDLTDESEYREQQIGEGSEVAEASLGEGTELAEQNVWVQMKEIVKFTGPVAGIWLCGPLMSLIDTAVVGQGSSVELAALGPATVFCDYLSYTFMFLSVATSNMVATALAKQDREEVQHHISVLLFIGLGCGLVMLVFTRLFAAATLTAFTGLKNVHVVPAANTYVQIRGLAWPALLIGWVAQSASLGMKDSWGPLKALAAASVINGIGDIVLCTYLGYGIAGAAWATLASQVVAAYMMSQTLNNKGYNAFAFSIPSAKEFFTILSISAPVFVTLLSKVAFYSLIIYFATSMGTHPMAAHQVMVQIYMACTIFGEPLSQTAQSFMPELMYGVNRSLAKARSLLRSLVIIGVILGLFFGIVGTSVPWLFPYIFTSDQMVIQEMHRILIPYFVALSVTPTIVGLEGTMLAGRDLRFLSLSMIGCFLLNTVVLLTLSSRYGLQGCWFALAGFQWTRFLSALLRLLSPNGILFSEDLGQYELQKLKTT
ncbi:protein DETOXIFICATION 46, chloroplastic-like [Lotus japonicus]|uniref:protein DETOXIFICATION 46, chloroplastic-like n=1 Tax=Lotus japonicus TaxID=34305 RepID=UPI00258AD911|nr:protein DETOXIFICATION 46, chloroplastic-like [Lotus japonicus]